MPKSSMSWREAHAWLAGYSAAMAGESWDSSNWDPDFTFHYQKGYANGEQRRSARLDVLQRDPELIVEAERIAV